MRVHIDITKNLDDFRYTLYINDMFVCTFYNRYILYERGRKAYYQLLG